MGKQGDGKDVPLLPRWILASSDQEEKLDGKDLSTLFFNNIGHAPAIANDAKHARELLSDFYQLEGCAERDVISLETGSLKPKWCKRDPNLEFGQEIAQAWIRRQDPDIQKKIGLANDQDIFKGRMAHKDACLFICSVVRVHDKDRNQDKNLLLLPSAYSRSDREGLGRTAILLSLAGLVVPYERLMGCSIASMPATICPRVSTNPPATHPLLVSDRAYLLIDRDAVQVIPTVSEPIDFMWDFTRHLYRSTQVEYEVGMLNDAKVRPDLLRLFSRTRLEPDVYRKYSPLWKTKLAIDEILLVELFEGNCDDVEISTISPQEWINSVCEGLRFSAEHTRGQILGRAAREMQ